MSEVRNESTEEFDVIDEEGVDTALEIQEDTNKPPTGKTEPINTWYVQNIS
jgi:hypothetical protein